MASFLWPPSGGGSGTVTSLSVVTANGFAGTVANPTIAPAITLSTTITGILQGNGTAISAATTGNLTSTPTTNLVVTGGTGAVLGAGALLTLTGASLVEATSSVLTITGATNAVLGTGVSIQVKQASTSVSGYLSNTDWNTFNNKGSGTVTAVSVASANGFAGSSSGGATPVLTLTTSITGILQGSGAAISAAATTGSGSVVLATAPTLSNPVVGTQSQGDGSTKAASTSYVDVAVANAIAGVNPAVAVQAATTAAGDTSGFTYNNGVSGIGATFTGTVNTAVTIDGFTFTALGQRLLVKNDTQSPSGAFNGIYYVTTLQTGILAPILTRALDYDTPSDMNNTGAIPVISGTVNGTTQWVLTSSVVTVGTTPLTFTQFARNPADYLLKANNLSDVASKSISFNNLSPMTTGGDLIYGGTSGVGTRLANGSSGQVLTSAGGTSAPTWSPVTTFTNSSVVSTSTTGFGSTNTKIRIFGTPSTTGSDITYATSATNGDTFIINTAGVYAVSYQEEGNTGAPCFGISINSSNLTTDIQSIAAANRLTIGTVAAGNARMCVSWVGICAVNDVLRGHTNATGTIFVNSAVCGITVTRVH